MRVDHAAFQNALRFVIIVKVRAGRRQINHYFHARLSERGEVVGRGLARRQKARRNREQYRNIFKHYRKFKPLSSVAVKRCRQALLLCADLVDFAFDEYVERVGVELAQRGFLTQNAQRQFGGERALVGPIRSG